jgi:ubiquinone/menaquinone biosynthesis C-methylase UbiE
MKHGDFTELAKYYVDRPGYSESVLNCIQSYIAQSQGYGDLRVADVGAGTGKLTENLMNLKLSMNGYAVEPNDAMREEGIKIFASSDKIKWLKGSAEDTGLEDSSVDWVLMGSSFHWTVPEKAMKEFHRILKPGGFFTAIWNPRNIESSRLHMEIEQIVYDEIHTTKRVSSGNKITSEEMAEKLMGSGYFEDMLFVEGNHEEVMTVERYMNIWKSVNDIQVQAGEEGFKRILEKIEDRLKGMDKISVPYRSRSWTVRSRK